MLETLKWIIKVIPVVLAGSVLAVFLAYMIPFAVTRAIRDGWKEGLKEKDSENSPKTIN